MNNLETIELMSPAGKIVVAKKDVNDYLNREGWSLIQGSISLEKVIPSKEMTSPEEIISPEEMTSSKEMTSPEEMTFPEEMTSSEED